ncbi:MAG: ISAzo13 family transposase [Pseudonocardia sp.]
MRFAALTPFLDERLRRVWAAAEASAIGRGGIEAVHRVTGLAHKTIRAGIADLSDEQLAGSDRVRRPGGGRTREIVKDPELLKDLRTLVEDATRGDPESPLLWVSRSVRNIADALIERGHRTNRTMVGELLGGLGFSLQAAVKTKEGTAHPDRDAQFVYLNTLVKARLAASEPVISVDTKKKELVGEFKNGGRELRPTGDPVKVNVHDFVTDLGRANPYGVYDLAADSAWVSVGTDHDTASFAVQTIRRWWQQMGQARYPDANELTITADCGGSNGYRTRLWKVELQTLADELQRPITVCHLPPGTSKWNRIEPRLFSHITMNWRGKPLVSHEVIVSLIAATSTRSGLTVQAELDTAPYPKGIKITDAQMNALTITRHDFHGDWNYTIRPRENRDVDP